MQPWILFSMIKDIPHKEFITSGDDVQWIIKVDDREQKVRLIFEESNDKRDWQNNFDFPARVYKKQTSCLRVARGWGNAYKSCNDIIMRTLIQTSKLYNDYKVEICGWSYGGAMSLLAAEDFHFRTGIKPDVVTFGAPKPLFGKKCKEYVLSCVGTVKQYAYVNDCVPLMPPFPFYDRVDTTYIGGKCSFLKLFKPNVYHLIYGEKELY